MSSASAALQGARPPDTDRIDANAAKAGEIVRWLRLLGEPARRVDHGAVGADLSDLYMSTETFRHQLGDLLAVGRDDPDAVAEKLNEITGGLRHMAWHIRSVTPRLERLESRLTPDDDGARPGVSRRAGPAPDAPQPHERSSPERTL